MLSSLEEALSNLFVSFAVEEINIMQNNTTQHNYKLLKIHICIELVNFIFL